MRETSLVYIVKDGKVLMLHRIRKKNDENEGKWIGVGGKFEQGECPEDCMRRETFEETGLYIDKYRYCGIVTFQNDEAETEFMHLFLVTEFHGSGAEGPCRHGNAGCPENGAEDVCGSGTADMGKVLATAEGDLEWLPVSMLTKIPHWTGDRIFLSLIFAKPAVPFFSLKLVYHRGVLVHSSLNEHNCLVTDRLILRPFLERDAEALWQQAKDPDIGPAAGWPPHKSPKDSLRVIQDVLSRPECYAIVLRDTGDPVGAVGLQNFRIADRQGSLISYYDEQKSIDPIRCTTPEQPAEGICYEAELGFWLGAAYQGRGLMTEAAGAVLAHGFRDLGLSRVWCSHFHGNERSAATQRRLGFHFHHEHENVQVKLPGEVRDETVNVMTREDFDRRQESVPGAD